MASSTQNRFFPAKLAGEHSIALEAALTVCLADPSHKPVHRLRKQTRRLEALLILFAHCPEIANGKLRTRNLSRSLRRLRRAAGKVRDLDVQGERLHAITEDHAPMDEGQGSERKTLAEAAFVLNKQLHKKRHRAAENLRKQLRKRAALTALATEALLASLASQESLSVPTETVTERVEAMVVEGGLLADSLTRNLSEDELHTIRKKAKDARYLAEMLPPFPALTGIRCRFKALQDIGGRWHDALEIAMIARRRFGRKHALTQKFSKERDGNLKLYRDALQTWARHLQPASDAQSPRPAERGHSLEAQA